MTGSDEQALLAFLARSGEWRAIACAAGDVELLRQYDHHVVTVSGRAALLLSYHLWSEPDGARVYLLSATPMGTRRRPTACRP